MKRKLERGKPLDEVLTRGSLDYTMAQIGAAWRKLHPWPMDDTAPRYWIAEIYAEYLIVEGSDLATGEYYRVPYSKNGDEYAFAARDQWEVVELTYQVVAPVETRATQESGTKPAGNGKTKRFKESLAVGVVLEESDGKAGPRRIRGDNVITAGIVNGNRRRYPAPVLETAIAELKTHLHESAGQGRLVQVLGEADHPSDKGQRGPQLLETVVKWHDVPFDGRDVSLRGHILETSRGRDLIALMEGGVSPGISLRGYGDSKYVTENGERIEQVTELHITGFDLVAESGFHDSVAVLESKQEKPKMDLEELKKLIGANPDLFKGLFEGKLEGKLEALGAEQLKKLEETVRAKLGLKPEDDLGKALEEAVRAQKTLADQDRRAAIVVEITKHTQDLPYGAAMNKAFTEAVQAQAFQAPDEVKAFVEAKRKEYDALAAELKLKRMGWGVQVVGPVLEQETGYPEFARGAFEFTEALSRRGLGRHVDPRKPQSRNELFAAQLLERFDQAYRYVQNGGGLIAEAKLLAEAEQTSDLSLPYSASRAIIAAAVAELIASSVFDFGVVDTSPTRVYYESYAADTTVTKTVAMGEAVVLGAASAGAYTSMAQKRVIPGTLTVKDEAEAVTYTEGTDYVCDYGNGALLAITGGALAAGATVHVGYQYDAIRKGEMGVIERGKGQLAFVTLECVADRLAQQVSQEAIVFSRSQIGWDAVTRTMSMIIEQIRRKIDKHAFYLGLASALAVASNSGGTWTSASDPLDDLVSYMGVAKVKIDNRYYRPESFVLSKTRSNELSNWTGFTAAGKYPTVDLKENGYVGRVKGLPVFETTEFTDAYVLCVNRELVAHRVYLPMVIKGPFPSYDTATGQMIAADQYYAEEFNGEVSPIKEKGSYVKIS